eukprot:190342-Chlamydomonas_euryale.AAC.1
MAPFMSPFRPKIVLALRRKACHSLPLTHIVSSKFTTDTHCLKQVGQEMAEQANGSGYREGGRRKRGRHHAMSPKIWTSHPKGAMQAEAIKTTRL